MLVPAFVGLATAIVPMSFALGQVVRAGVRDQRPAPPSFETKAPSLFDYSPAQRAFQVVAATITVLVVTQPVELVAFAAGSWAGVGIAFAGMARRISSIEKGQGLSYWIREQWWDEFSAGEPQQEYLYFCPRRR